MAKKTTTPYAEILGRLKSIGIQEPWQATFMLPSGYDDLREVHTDFNTAHIESEEWGVFRGRLYTLDFRGDGVPRLVGRIEDHHGTQVGFIVFGDTKALQEHLKEFPDDVILYGQGNYLDGRLWLKSVEIINPAWIGHIRPRYNGKKRVITPTTARTRIMACLKQGGISTAVQWLVKTLQMSANELLTFSRTDAESLEILFKRAHLPTSIEQATESIKSIERIAALGVIKKALREKTTKPKLLRQFGSVDKAISQVPFRMTEEQMDAAHGIVAAFASGQCHHVLLSGDVGVGKTVVYGAVIIAALEVGLRVVCLLPSETLSEQIHREIDSYWPQYAKMLVTGETPPSVNLEEIPLLIGTSALLFRPVGNRDLVCVDEQQKFSRGQREQLMSSDSLLIEATATCVPRSQALIQFGGVKVFRLKKCHVDKTIVTRIWSEAERGKLFQGVKETLAAGNKVLVVYPKREVTEVTENSPELQDATTAYEQWDRAFPGQVRLAHGGIDDAENLEAINDVREGRAAILVATSLIEVGITINKLQRVVVVHAERFGLSTLHQIRGRVARQGGIGYCDLFLPKRVSDDSFSRLRVLVDTNDGFKVAMEDMRQRGFGDLGEKSQKQTGADDTFLFGRPLSLDTLEEVMSELALNPTPI